MNRKQKEFTTIFLSLYVVGFLMFNWADVSWIFNYRVMESLVYDFFNPYQSNLVLTKNNTANTLVYAGSAPTNSLAINETNKPIIYPYTEKSDSLEITSLSIISPTIIGQSTNNTILLKDLDRGVVYYPGSVLPGQTGQTIILGHSAPPNWPKIKHDWVFSGISTLTNGEKVTINFKNKVYTYEVIDQEIIEVGQDISITGFESKDNVLVLVSCWPPGKNYKRIAVYAKLLNPQE